MHVVTSSRTGSRAQRAQSSEQIFAEAVRLHQAKRFNEAERAYREVLARAPRDAASFDALGRIACETRRYAVAAELCGKAVALDPNAAHYQVNLGNAFKELGRLDEAIQAYRQAIALKPNYAEAYGNLGTLYISQGRGEEACRAFETASEFSPQRGMFYRLRAFAKPLVQGDPIFRRMEALADSIATLPAHDAMELHFALGTAYGDCGAYQRSFAHLVAGNALKRQAVSYDEGKALSLLHRIETIFSREFLAARRDFGLASRLPVFIVGMPRSGSTLIEQILASHPEAFGAGELPILPHLLNQADHGKKIDFPDGVPALAISQIHRLAEQYVTVLRAESSDATRIVDKLLENFMGLGLIALMFPHARIIHIKRDPVDTCLSCFAKLFNGNHLPYTYELTELGRFYRGYVRLMDHWRNVLPPGMMLEVQYEDLVGDFDLRARRIVAHCGLAWDERCRDFHRTERVVKTASALQVRQAIQRSSLDKWRAYRDLAQPLVAALAGD